MIEFFSLLTPCASNPIPKLALPDPKRVSLLRLFGAALLTFLSILADPVPLAAQGVIFVTSLADKVNGIGGCSLQEAMYAATFQKSESIVSYAADGNSQYCPDPMRGRHR